MPNDEYGEMNSPELREPRRNPIWQADPVAAFAVPVAKPRLPSAESLLPYLQRIDESRWYSNGGPLVLEFEERLRAHCGGAQARLVTVANATIGLSLALLALDFPPGAICMVPSWTFAATGHAVLLAGLVPWIVDVSPETWGLEPAMAREILPSAPGRVAAIVPVSPYGAAQDWEGWGEFRAETGIPVVLDAAAAFDCVTATALPAVVSLHATKACGIGEGGFVVSTEGDFIEEIQKRANFGFWYSREATARSLNGKISEYAAAVGLAALDCWPETRTDFERVAVTYRKALSGQDQVQLQPGAGESWIASTIMVSTPQGRATAVGSALAAAGIGSRRWWGGGLHRHKAFADFPRTEMTHTHALAERTIGLPCWRDLRAETIAKICEIIRSVAT